MKYRFRKVTPKILKQMKELRKSGLSYKKIAEEFGLNSSTVGYHLNPRSKKQTIKRAMKSYNKLSKKQKVEKNKKTAEYRKKYYNKRYHNDPEFRKSLIKSILKYQKKNKWKKNKGTST